MPISTLHLTNAYHEHSGGIRTMYHALLEYAEQHERRMTLVVPGPHDREERRGRFTRIVHVRAPRSMVGDGRYRMLLPHRFLPAGRGPLWRLLEHERPDVVEVCDKYSLCYFAGLIRRRRLHRRPSLVGLTCERMDDNVEAYLASGTFARGVARAIVGRVYVGMFDVHIANSEYTAEELRSAMRAPHVRPIHVCPPGVEMPERIAEDDVTAARRDLLDRCGRHDATILLYAGRLSPEKHVLVLPRVVSTLSTGGRIVHLVIAGDGPLRRRVEAEAAATAPGRVHVIGHVNRQTLWRLLRACDVFIHPNPREPFGIGPLEAMAAGAPVVVPASGGVRTYAGHDNAWLSPPDPLAMAAAVSDCLDDADGCRRRVVAGLRTAERYAWPHAASRMFAHYDATHLTAMHDRLTDAASRRLPVPADT